MPLAVGLGALILAVLGIGWYLGRERPSPAKVAERPMIVVFPFENLGPAADEYFAAGIADEITSRLSALKDLGVLSRTSALRYDRTGRTMPQIAEDLGVDYVLYGTVRWARDASGKSAVRVTPPLDDCRPTGLNEIGQLVDGHDDTWIGHTRPIALLHQAHQTIQRLRGLIGLSDDRAEQMRQSGQRLKVAAFRIE